MRSSKLLLVSVAAVPAAWNVAEAMGNNIPYLRMGDLPGVANPESANWISLTKDTQFLEVDELPKIPTTRQLHRPRHRALGGDEDEDYVDVSGQYDSANPYSVQPFIQGMGEYDEYQQAWRMLGFMIDCNPSDANDYGSQHSNSGSEETTDDECARYVLWAAYVDLYYEGAGIGEYQYWDKENKKWDDTACYYAEGGGSGDGNSADNNGGDQQERNLGNGYKSRCAKMDCHNDDTQFSLLGFFKHRSYDDWMEQLFKHEGMCVWTEEEYAFMKSARNAWPQGCTVSNSYTKDGQLIYYDVKPMPEGRITVGLYTDTECVETYSSDIDKVEDILGNFFVNNGGSEHSSDENYANYDFSSESLQESMDRWNSAFDVWHYCHPCVAYDIENIDGKSYTDDDDYVYQGNGDDDGGRRLGGEYNAQGDVFECYDDAGYTNVNQCMKFSAKTTMETATFRDIMLARVQNSLVERPLAGYLQTKGNYRGERKANTLTTLFFLSASILFICSLITLCKVAYEARQAKNDLNSSGDLKNELLVEKGTKA